MVYILRIKGHFAASHTIPEHEGKCSRLHGHTYHYEVAFSYDELQTEGSSEGMAEDFARLKYDLEAVEKVLDHQHLNDSLPLDYMPPTAENVARYMYNFIKRLGTNKIQSVTLWETPKYGISYFE